MNELHVVFELVDLVDHHAAMNAAQNRRLAVMREVVARRLQKELKDSAKPGAFFGDDGPVFGSLPRGVGVFRDAGELPRNVSWSQHVIDAAGRNPCRACRHIWPSILLREGYTALGLNFGHPERSIRAGAGKNYADALISLIRGKRTHESVDGHVAAGRIDSRFEYQGVIHDRHGALGGIT